MAKDSSQKQPMSIYTVMLLLSLLALLFGCLFLWLELIAYNWQVRPPRDVTFWQPLWDTIRLC